jgi:hypothetical protein
VQISIWCLYFLLTRSKHWYINKMYLDPCYYCSFPRRSKGSCITQWKMAISNFILSRKNWNYQDWNLFCSRKLVKSSCIPRYWSSLWIGDPKALELQKERKNNFSFWNILRKLEPLGLNLIDSAPDLNCRLSTRFELQVRQEVI